MYVPAEFSTTLGSATLSGATSFSVASATGLPVLAAGDITVVRLDDGAGAAENALVTAISGTTLTCTALASAHSSGATAKGSVIDIAALTQIRKDALAMGPEVAITATATATLGKMHRCAPTAADITLTVPDGAREGDMIAFRVGQTATKFVTLSTAALIDGVSTRLIWRGESAYLRWDSANSTWTKVAGRSIPMMARLARSAAQSVSTASATLVQFDQAAFDNTGVLADLPNNSIVIKRAGSYRMTYTVGFTAVSATTPRVVSVLRKNGASFNQSETGNYVAGANATTVGGSEEQLAAADVMSLQAFQNSGSAQTLAHTVTQGAPVTLSAVEVPAW